MVDYRKIWKNSYGKIPKGYEIHHIDGDRNNNDLNNLQCITLQEHLEIHLKQNDYGAVKAILMRTDSNIDMVEISRKLQLKLLAENNHNFQKMTKERRSNISKKVGYETRDLQLGIHKINANPELAKTNGKRAGLIGASKKSGFLNTESKNHGSVFVKNTFWWTNQNNERIRTKKCPGDNWKKGMKYE